MDSVKISELNELTVAKTDDLIPIVDTETGETKKIKAITLGNVGGITGDTLPIGSMVPYGNENPPTNWLICDGSEISRFTYSDLFNVIGTSYGEGDGSTTFNIPNLKGKIPVGFDSEDEDFNAIGKTGGEKTHTLSINEMPSHGHNTNLSGGTETGINRLITSDWSWNTKNQQNSGLINSSGGGQPHNNLQPYEVDNWIIKAFQSAGVVAEVEQDLSSDSTINVPSVKAINDNLKTEYILVTISSSQTISSNYVINFNSVVDSYGDKLTLQNGKIVIGAGISKIRVSGSLFVDNWAGGTNYIWGKLGKNSNTFSTSINSGSSSYLSCVIAPTIENVQQGDTISLIADSPSGGALRSGRAQTFLLVEVVY